MIYETHPATDLKLVFEPSVYLNFQTGNGPDLQRFLDDHGYSDWRSTSDIPAEVSCEIGGRLCYMSFGKPRPGGNAAYLERIKSEAHGSVVEHATFTIVFAGVSRSLTHELVRHRAGMGYSQLSQRYVDESDVAFVVPPRLVDAVREALQMMQNEDFDLDQVVAMKLCHSSSKSINAGLRWLVGRWNDLAEYRSTNEYLETDGFDRKSARETSRSCLPNCAETNIQVTGNGRAWRHWLEQRGSAGADAEIRRLAFQTLPTLQAAAPNIFGDYSIEDHPSGGKHINTTYRKI